VSKEESDEGRKAEVVEVGGRQDDRKRGGPGKGKERRKGKEEKAMQNSIRTLTH
jgi:hypothetical protein